MISIYLKDFDNLKAKLKQVKKHFQKIYVFCTLVNRNQLSNLFCKERAFPV